MGSTACGGRFPVEMLRLRTSDYDCQKAGGEEYQGNPKKRRIVENTKYIVKNTSFLVPSYNKI